jgi:hypothetical protein
MGLPPQRTFCLQDSMKSGRLTAVEPVLGACKSVPLANAYVYALQIILVGYLPLLVDDERCLVRLAVLASALEHVCMKAALPVINSEKTCLKQPS